MAQEKIIIANLKCAGCANTIRTKLLALGDVEQVEINHDEDSVTIYHGGKNSRKDFTDKLYSLGYPEATEENGLLLQLKSYASCMVGRLQKDTE